MKKILLFMMVFIFAFAFIGCIEETTTETQTTTTTQQTTTQQTTTQQTTTQTTTTEVVTTTDNDPVISGATDITIEKNSTFIPLEGVGNEVTKDRTVTVSYGDFIFGDSTDYVLADLSETAGVYSTPVFSGGVINQSIADFTYVKVNVTLTSAAAGTVNISLNGEDASRDSLAVTGTSESFEVIYVITEALTDVTFDIDSNGVTLSDIAI